jgi:hypothetical protein
VPEGEHSIVAAFVHVVVVAILFMLVRIVRQPHGTMDGVGLHHYKFGRAYDIDTLLAGYLIVQGFAIVEMRRGRRSFRLRPSDRRKTP